MVCLSGLPIAWEVVCFGHDACAAPAANSPICGKFGKLAARSFRNELDAITLIIVCRSLQRFPTHHAGMAELADLEVRLLIIRTANLFRVGAVRADGFPLIRRLEVHPSDIGRPALHGRDIHNSVHNPVDNSHDRVICVPQTASRISRDRPHHRCRALGRRHPAGAR